jgi:DNA polymerase-1
VTIEDELQEVVRAQRRHPEAECERCPLYDVGKFVPSVGPTQADVAFVGEAPGRQEADKGVPFMGPSGRLLNTVLKYHGIKRNEVLLSNACLCRPPENATPPQAAIAACRPRLQRELRDRGVTTVVALGNSASLALLSKSGVTKLRIGPGRPSVHDPDLRVISTIHPAACLRSADNFPSLVTDVGKVVNKGAVWNNPQYEVIADPVDAARVLRSLRNGTGPVAIDIECNIEKDSGFDHPNHYDMLCIGLADSSDWVFVLARSALVEDVYVELAELLRRRGIIAQNGKFDLAGLYSHTGQLELTFDTMLASYVCDERPGQHALDLQGREHLGAPDWKNEIAKYNPKVNGYDSIPPDVLHKYNAYDLAVTYRLYEMYRDRFDRDASGDLWRVHNFLCRASNELMFLELNGIAIDRAYLRQLEAEYLDRIEGIVNELRHILELRGIEIKNSKDQVIPFNPNSPQQVKKALWKLGVKVPGTDKHVMAKLVDKLHSRAIIEGKDVRDDILYQFIMILLKHRREAKLYGTYIKGARKRLYRGRLYPTFLLHGSTSGRLACRNPNLQNVPRESSIRRLYVPGREGNIFVQVDYSQAELRVLSYLAGDTYFRDIFNSGERDLFDELTPILYPELPPKHQVDPKVWKETRIRVKAYVYGLAYGRTEFSIADEFGISVEEARRGMAAFFNVIPEIVQFRDKTKRDILSGNDLVTPFGRHRRFMLITEENKMDVVREGLSFLPQSTASDMCLGALTIARPKLRGIAFIRNIIHDALLIETAPEDVEEVIHITSTAMSDSAQSIVKDYVKFATEATMGASWGDV